MIPIKANIEEKRSFRAFDHRNFRLFFSGQTISLLGTWSQQLAISWLVWKMTRSPAWVGAIGFMLQFPMLLAGIPAGVFADRYDRLRSLKFLQAACMVQALILAALTISGHVKLWQVASLSVALGFLYSLEFPVRQSFIMDVVGKGDILSAVSLNAAMVHTTRVAGPMIAGLIVAWSGEGPCFLFNALTFIFLIACLLLVDRRQMVVVETDKKAFLHSLSEGVRYMRGDRQIKFTLLIIAVVSLFGMPVLHLMPIFADAVFGGGAVELGWLMGSGAAGSLVGAIWLARRKTPDGLLSLAASSLILTGIALVIFSIAPSLKFALPTIAAAGCFQTITISSCITLFQDLAPDNLRGRIMSFLTTAFMGFAPIGSLACGFAAMEFGAPLTITVCGIGCSLMSAIILIKILRRKIH